MAEKQPETRICRLASCGAAFEPSVSWQWFCKAEHRQMWNSGHYCGHRTPISECTVEGCEAHALFLMVQMFETRFSQCRCGRYFERTVANKRHCSRECRYAAKNEAERERKHAV